MTAKLTPRCSPGFLPRVSKSTAVKHSRSVRRTSTEALPTPKTLPIFPTSPGLRHTEPQALARLPTSNIIRSLFLGAFFSSPLFFKPGFTILKGIANSKTRLLDPDLNPLLRAIIKPLIYNHFCAGTNKAEVQAKIAQTKALGYSGVVLCYTREILLQNPKQPQLDEPSTQFEAVDIELEQWKEGNLATLDMLDPGDIMGLKFTGAGTRTTHDLLYNHDPPPALLAVMHTLLTRGAAKHCRIWIDAEQQRIQPTIDRWALLLMAEHNRGTKPVLYTTLQAYLKSSRATLRNYLERAHAGGFTYAVKLVRGAYIEHEDRSLIHGTKAETDASYDGIVADLLRGSVEGVPGERMPATALFLAGHNKVSVAQACELAGNLREKGNLKTVPEFGLLQGMAEELGGALVLRGEEEKARLGVVGETGGEVAGAREIEVPRVYRCLHWGSVRECMQYLVRRAVENRGATAVVKEGMGALVRELERRVRVAVVGEKRGAS